MNCISLRYKIVEQRRQYGSVPVDLLRPKLRFAHEKDYIISILVHKYTYTKVLSYHLTSWTESAIAVNSIG